MNAFDSHESGQLRLSVAGEQASLLPLPDALIPSAGPGLASAALPRKVTKYLLCDRHRGWFSGATRCRAIECLAEGGPGGMSPGCTGGHCHLWPGTDMFVVEVCFGEMDLEWTRV